MALPHSWVADALLWSATAVAVAHPRYRASVALDRPAAVPEGKESSHASHGARPLTHQSALTASGTISRWPVWLGAAGLAPQLLLAVTLMLAPAPVAGIARDLALAYAALILSFVGGAWWGLVSRSRTAVRGSVWLMAVAPSLLAFGVLCARGVGLASGWGLSIIAAALVGALLFDRRLVANGLCPLGWFRLRLPLSLGLAGLSLLIALVP